MTATMKLRTGCATRRQAVRQRGRRWDMRWTAPPFWWLVGECIGVSGVAGLIGGTLVLPVFGSAVGAVAGIIGSLFVAPLVAVALRRLHHATARRARRRARLVAVPTTAIVFQVVLPLIVTGRPAGFDSAYPVGVAIAMGAAWCAAHFLVQHAMRRPLRTPS